MNDENYEEIKTSQATINLKREQKLGIIGTIKFEELKGMISSDQTGGFPLTSRQGNKYILIIYNYDSNSIHAIAISTRYQHNIVQGY